MDKQALPRKSWSLLSPTNANLEKLNLLTTSSKVLAKEGYQLTELTEAEIWKKMRCVTCGQRLKRYYPSFAPGSGLETDLISFEDSGSVKKVAVQSQTEQKHVCFYHDGELWKSRYKCCDGHMFSKGCMSYVNHEACDLKEVRAQWSFARTPTSEVYSSNAGHALIRREQTVGTETHAGGGRSRYLNVYGRNQQIPKPVPIQQKLIHKAVALDCEMGTPKNGTSLDSVLIRLSMVDLFSGATLIDKLVMPDVDMLHYNTKYSGVTFAMMRIARQRREAIWGLAAAQEMVFRYIDPDTYIIVHGGSSDLLALRIIHPPDKIIDTHILENWSQDVREGKLKRGLKEACMRRCGIAVQDAKLDNGKAAGHDSLEDALACREIVCAWMRTIPDV